MKALVIALLVTSTLAYNEVSKKDSTLNHFHPHKHGGRKVKHGHKKNQTHDGTSYAKYCFTPSSCAERDCGEGVFRGDYKFSSLMEINDVIVSSTWYQNKLTKALEGYTGLTLNHVFPCMYALALSHTGFLPSTMQVCLKTGRVPAGTARDDITKGLGMYHFDRISVGGMNSAPSFNLDKEEKCMAFIDVNILRSSHFLVHLKNIAQTSLVPGLVQTMGFDLAEARNEPDDCGPTNTVFRKPDLSNATQYKDHNPCHCPKKKLKDCPNRCQMLYPICYAMKYLDVLLHQSSGVPSSNEIGVFSGIPKEFILGIVSLGDNPSGNTFPFAKVDGTELRDVVGKTFLS